MKAVLISDRTHVTALFNASVELITDLDLSHISERIEDIADYLDATQTYIIFLDMSSEFCDTVYLLKMLKIQCPKAAIICILDDAIHFEICIRYKTDYFLLEPYTQDDIKDAVVRAKCLLRANKKRVYFRTFGRFDMFIDDKLVHFRNSKAKELLALCVDHRGGIVKMEEAIDKLWEDRVYDDKVKNLYRHAVKYVRDLLKAYNIDDVFKNGRGVCCVRYDSVDCDLFYYLENINNGIYGLNFTGSYMSEYTWAEDTVAMLEKLDARGKV